MGLPVSRLGCLDLHPEGVAGHPSDGPAHVSDHILCHAADDPLRQHPLDPAGSEAPQVEVPLGFRERALGLDRAVHPGLRAEPAPERQLRLFPRPHVPEHDADMLAAGLLVHLPGQALAAVRAGLASAAALVVPDRLGTAAVPADEGEVELPPFWQVKVSPSGS